MATRRRYGQSRGRGAAYSDGELRALHGRVALDTALRAGSDGFAHDGARLFAYSRGGGVRT